MSNLVAFSQAGLPAVSTLSTALRAIQSDVGLGTGILLVVAVRSSSSPWTPVILIAGFLGAVLYGSRSPRRSAMFTALLVVVVLDVVALIASPAL